ncbi:MAG: hypothetical protein AAFW81_07190 [Pseudomonadota bacterium]
MKKLALIASALGLAVSPALAGDKAKWDEKMAEKFSGIDANNDGSISEAEYMAHKVAYYEKEGKELTDEKAEKARAHFAKMSGDDGALTLAEMKDSYKKKKKDKDRSS